MKRVFAFAICGLAAMSAFAQAAQPFKGTIYNKEYNLYITMNLYEQNVVVPHQELFGEVAGFLGDHQDERKWLFTAAKIKKNVADLEITNDYGSEDLTAQLVANKDSTYTLLQKEGSDIKIARDRKYKKIPKILTFTLKKE